MFAALDDEDASTLYYTYAFLYALPYLANGWEVDGFAVLALLVGVAHVQVGAGGSGAARGAGGAGGVHGGGEAGVGCACNGG